MKTEKIEKKKIKQILYVQLNQIKSNEHIKKNHITKTKRKQQKTLSRHTHTQQRMKLRMNNVDQIQIDKLKLREGEGKKNENNELDSLKLCDCDSSKHTAAKLYSKLRKYESKFEHEFIVG